MCDLVFYFMESNNALFTKIGMIDLGSKLCMKFPHVNSVQDILHYFFRFYYYNNQENIVDKFRIYEYYDLNRDEDHVNTCREKKIIF